MSQRMSRRAGSYPNDRSARRGRAAVVFLTIAVLVAACGGTGGEASAIDEVTLDWAYYNPVSLVLKENGWIEEELGGDVEVTWVQSAGSNKAIEFLNARSIDFGSTAGAAALLARINGSPITSVYAYSRPEWTALVALEESGIDSVDDLEGKTVAVTKGTDPYIFLLRALSDHGLDEGDIDEVLLQHADGRNALISGDVDAWAGLDPMMAEAELEQAATLFYRAPELNTWGVLNVDEEFARANPEVVEAVIAAYERARLWAVDNPDELAAILAEAAGLSIDVAKRQLERTDLSVSSLGTVQLETILGAGLALQGSGVIEEGVDVAAAVDALLDERFTEGLGSDG